MVAGSGQERGPGRARVCLVLFLRGRVTVAPAPGGFLQGVVKLLFRSPVFGEYPEVSSPGWSPAAARWPRPPPGAELGRGVLRRPGRVLAVAVAAPSPGRRAPAACCASAAVWHGPLHAGPGVGAVVLPAAVRGAAGVQVEGVARAAPGEVD